MARPKGPDGLPLPPAHRRLDPVPFHEAALFAMDADPRACALSMKRKLQLIDRAINTTIDGDAAPAWVWVKDESRPNEHFLPDLWNLALNACGRVKRAGHG